MARNGSTNKPLPTEQNPNGTNTTPAGTVLSSSAVAEAAAGQVAADQGTAPATEQDQAEANRQAELQAREAALEARENAVKEAESRVTELDAKIDKRLEQIDARIAALSRNDKAPVVNNQEKADIVTALLEAAYEKQPEALADPIEYTPMVTMANLTAAGTIVFEKGIKYLVPRGIVEDLERRQIEHLDYRENLHVHNVDILDSGTISGGGK